MTLDQFNIVGFASFNPGHPEDYLKQPLT